MQNDQQYEQASDLFQKVRRLEISTKKSVTSLFSGIYRSVFKGRGIESEEIREFQEGDDIRSVSWAKTAQMGRPFVKNFREERDLSVMILTDISGSVNFGSHFEKKRGQIAEIVALLAFSAISNSDRVGLILFSDKVEKCVLPRRGTRHGLSIVRDTLAYPASSKMTDIKVALEYFNKITSKSSIVFLISDFISPDFALPLSISAMKHDVVAIRIFDPEECEIPSIGVVSLQDLETERQVLVDIDAENAATYSENQKNFEDSLRACVVKSGAGLVEISTAASVHQELETYFRARKKLR